MPVNYCNWNWSHQDTAWDDVMEASLPCPNTPWKINMEHNSGGLEDDFPFPTDDS